MALVVIYQDGKLELIKEGKGWRVGPDGHLLIHNENNEPVAVFARNMWVAVKVSERNV